MGIKDANSEKKRIQVSLRRPGTPVSTPIRPERPTEAKLVLGALKSDFSPPAPALPPTPPLQIDPATSQALRAFTQQEKDRITQELTHHKAQALSDIADEMAQIRQTRLQEINAEINQIKETAIQSGHQEGKQKAESSYTQKLLELTAVINDVAENKHRFLKDSESELLTLSLKIAEHLIQKSIELDPETITSVITTAIRRITDKDKVIIKVSPDDADIVRQRRDQILEKMPDIRSLEIHDDPKLERGGCIIETRLGYIDASLKTGFESVKTALFNVLNDHS